MNIQKKLILVIMISGAAGCYVPEKGYYPDYDEDYIYSVSYYGYRPYNWGEGYYNTYGYGTRDFVNKPKTEYNQPRVLERKYYNPRPKRLNRG